MRRRYVLSGVWQRFSFAIRTDSKVLSPVQISVDKSGTGADAATSSGNMNSHGFGLYNTHYTVDNAFVGMIVLKKKDSYLPLISLGVSDSKSL